MIEITVTPDRITMKGHAGFAEKGKDIVCGAVSVLAHTFIHSLSKLCTEELGVRIASGNMEITYKDLSQRAQLLLSSFLIGVTDVADTYPDYVKVIADLSYEKREMSEDMKMDFFKGTGFIDFDTFLQYYRIPYDQ